ncbi:protein of unknown function DUF1697 [Paenibacillus curdlanolyticus YK9]|uniref:Cytoplasmic protein n=1 Tax=Paenibacillus curdlanolyticus YK9 TaxID=717606 RepID=E0I6K4_9BACL|nr:DUF1697 domain-containing protein [Paenibacillus curdlanolyticus]EFM11670.1 protein of unknown function DUF1697 [Paenibacillus curdlanolyticus YK9]
MTVYIALLRGINVGGKNKIKMADLREALEGLGLSKVQTYIQSGNILFESNEDEATLRVRIEQEVEKSFQITLSVIIRTSEQLNAIAANCPFTEEQLATAAATCEGESLYVTMLQEKPDSDKLDKLQQYQTADEQYRLADRDVYLLFGRSIRNAKLAVQVEKLGVPTTTRNWNTINKLVQLAKERVEQE